MLPMLSASVRLSPRSRGRGARFVHAARVGRRVQMGGQRAVPAADAYLAGVYTAFATLPSW
jgi:hypothetical protein